MRDDTVCEKCDGERATTNASRATVVIRCVSGTEGPAIIAFSIIVPVVLVGVPVLAGVYAAWNGPGNNWLGARSPVMMLERKGTPVMRYGGKSGLMHHVPVKAVLEMYEWGQQEEEKWRIGVGWGMGVEII